MAKTKKRELGDKGEDVVCRYLEEKGYVVLERNYWKPWGEIDVIAKKGSILSFIEVKSVSRDLSNYKFSQETPTSRTGFVGYRPEENMHPAKVKRLHRAIQTYLLDHKISEDQLWQLDLACVFLDLSLHTARVEVLENIVL